MKFDKKYVYYFKGNYYIWFGEHNGETYFDISVQPVQECELMRISSAIGVLSEPAWKPVFSVLFGLSSLKGTRIPSSSAPKTPQKYKPFRSKNLNIIKIFVNKAKAQRILDVFASILTQFTGIFIYLNRSSDNTPMAMLIIRPPFHNNNVF